MALFSLLNRPFVSEKEKEYWSWAHWQHHLEIAQAIQAQFGSNLTLYPLYPIPIKNLDSWLLRHQQYHDDMNSVLGLNGVDLQTVNFKQEKEAKIWVQFNFNEHRDAATKLRI